MAAPRRDEASIFNAARRIEDPAARRQYVDQACGDDPRLRARIDALLRVHDQDSSFLEPPTEGFAALGEEAILEGPGTRIGPYQLVEPLGEGGMGTVFLAEQTQPVRRQVALKIIKPGMDSRQIIARFEVEKQALALMDHPNIARVFDAGTTPLGRPYFIMELVHGQPITRYCDEHRLTPRHRLELFLPVCQAVQHAHQKGVIHRDLKPSNVLVTLYDGKPVPKVIDFGVAKATELKLTKETLTELGAVIGTPEYMSPEQADPNQVDIDTRTDVYALGVLLYELLTGTTPLHPERLQAVGLWERLQRVRDEEPPRPSARLSTIAELPAIAANRGVEPKRLKGLVRGELDWIVMKTLEKDRGRRYATANGLARDIERYLQNEPVEAGPPSVWYKVRKLAGKHRKPLAAAGAFASLLTAVIVVSTWLVVRAMNAEQTAIREHDWAVREHDRVVRQLYVSHMNLAQTAWEDARVARVVQLLDQHLPKTGDDDLRDFEWHYWKRLTDTAVLTLRHSGGVRSVVFSPDGKRLATASEDRTIKIWDAATGKVLLTLEGHKDLVTGVAFSPDGLRLASASWDRTVKIWDAATGRVLLPLEGHKDGVIMAVSFSPDGHRLTSASYDHTVKVWDAATGRVLRTIKGHQNWILGVAYSPDGRCLASASADRTAKVWDAATGRVLLTLEGHTAPVHGVAYSPDGRCLASASADRTVRVWDAATGRVLLTLEGHTAPVHGVAYSPDGRRLASASADRTVRVWDAATGEQLLSLRGHTGEVCAVSFSPDGRCLASASFDHTVKIWDAAPGQQATMVLEPKGQSRAVAFSPDGRWLAWGGDSRWVMVWDVASGLERFPRFPWERHTGFVHSVAYSPDGNWLASASTDKTVKIWNAQTGRVFRTLEPLAHPILSVAFSPDGTRLAGASAAQRLRVWNVATRQETLTLNEHNGTVAPDEMVASVVFSPDGKWLASGGADKVVKVWDAATGQQMLSLEGHTGPVTSVVFNPDSTRLASGSYDTTVKLWDLASGQAVRTLEGHTAEVSSVAFSPDGKRLATAGKDKTVKLWDVVSGQETLTLKGHAHSVTCVAFSPDGQRLASSSHDKTVRIWDARPWTPQLRIEQRARSLVSSLYADLWPRSKLTEQNPVINRLYTDLLKPKVIKQIHQDATLEPDVRQEALEMVKRWQSP